MAPPPSNAPKVLDDLLSSTLALLEQFSASLNPVTGIESASAKETHIDNPPDPLPVLRDAAKLLKAHTTKLSLLAITPPFTHSAVTKVLRELTSTCLPAMMSAVQICVQEQKVWGDFLIREVRGRVRRVFVEMQCLLREIQSISRGDERSTSSTATSRRETTRRDSLSSTGVVWEACDALVELQTIGIAGLAVMKAEQYRETIRDAIAELQEWRDGADLESEGTGDGLLDSDDEGVDGDRDSIEDIFHAANSMPKDRPELEKLVAEADGALKKIVILYSALVKRRLTAFVAVATTATSIAKDDEPVVFRLDRVMMHLRRIPHQIDEMASYFYDLDEDQAEATLVKCIDEAMNASRECESDWAREEDKYSEWFRKWQEAMAKIASQA